MFNKDMKIHIDWRWVGIGYCFFVVFLVLMTSYIIFKPVETYFDFQIPFASFFTFIGFIFIAFYIGYRSKGIAIFESGISAVLFIGTGTIHFPWNASGHSIFEIFFGCLFGAILIFSLASICAWVGKYVYTRINLRTDAHITKV